MIQFNKIKPHHLLQKFIHTYWHISSAKTNSPIYFNRVFPDCFTDVIFNFGDKFVKSLKYSNSNENIEDSFVAGIMLKPIIVGLSGNIDLIGISFKPGCAMKFLGLPINEIADQRVSLSNIWEHHAHEFTDTLKSKNSLLCRINYIDGIMIKRLSYTDKIDLAIDKCVDYTFQNDGQITIDELESLTGFSSRQLERKYKSHVGVGPKALSRIIRFKKAVSTISYKNQSLANTAYNTGYSDQAHFSREIKTFTGLTPGEFFNKNYSDVVFFQD